MPTITVTDRQLDTITTAIQHYRKSFPSLMTYAEFDEVLRALASTPDQSVITHRDTGPSAETLARECAAAVATRKLGDTPQVSRKGMALGSILAHPPADPTDATTLTGDELPDELDSREWVGAAGLDGEKFGPTPDQ